MRAVLLVLLLVALAGCASWSKPPVPKQPEAPTDGGVMSKVGKDLDKVDGRVAAAVTVAKENADKPEVVKAETGVALSYLPAPSEGDVAFARQRAAKADQKAYKDAEEYGKQLLKKINADWSKMEADQKEAKRVSDLKDRRIEELVAEVERVKKEASKSIWTLLGAGLFAVGALTSVFLGPRLGIPLLLCGAFAGGVPYIIDSPYFLWVCIGTAAIAAGLGLWWVWDKVRDSINTPPPANP